MLREGTERVDSANNEIGVSDSRQNNFYYTIPLNLSIKNGFALIRIANLCFHPDDDGGAAPVCGDKFLCPFNTSVRG